jgi:protein gp37
VNETGIIWTEVSWNPVSGCKLITAGCAFCYAKTLAENKRGGVAFPNGFGLTYRPHKLREPLKLKEPTLIFVNSMSDMFWEDIDDEYRDRMLDVIEATPQHEYQVLTKRPEVMLAYSRRRKLPPNFWAGVTIENQENGWRAAVLQDVDASIRFISAEPLLGPVVLPSWAGIHWVITGGESGVHLVDPALCARRGLVDYDATRAPRYRWQPREDRVQWVRDIRDQALDAGVKFFHKQWGGQYPKSGGRVLDGRTWDEFPRLPGNRTAVANRFIDIVGA